MLEEVEHLARLHEVGLRTLIARGADQLVGEHRVRDGRALVRFLRLHQRHVGQTGGGSTLVGAARHRGDVVEEQRRRPDDREVLLARADQRVARLVRAQMRVDEVDLHPAAGQSTAAVDELREGSDTVHHAFEQAWSRRVVDVCDDGDPDRVAAQADVGVLEWLGLARGCGRGRRHPQRGPDDQRGHHHDPAPARHRSPRRRPGTARAVSAL